MIAIIPNLVARKQAVMEKMEPAVRALAPLGNLFLVITLPELRREGITYLSLYALERAIRIADHSTTHRFTEEMLRRETGVHSYEASRACRLLTASGLAELGRDAQDRRIRVLLPTPLGRRVLRRILSSAAKRLWEALPSQTRVRQMADATQALQQVHEILCGEFELFFPNSLQSERSRRRSQNVALVLA